MRVKYIYSACIVIETADCRICCDPWFTQGIYDGSWYQFPRVADPITAIGKVDFVYISHIHPDHYDPSFLRELLIANPDCSILVGRENQDFLRTKMRHDGFEPLSVSRHSIRQTEIGIFPNFAHGEINIDSALAVKSGNLSVVNMNDCPFDENQVVAIREFCGGDPNLACLPYAGAGPYPQMYMFKSDNELVDATERKKEQFLDLFGRYLEALRPRYALPFAGLYFLGGTLRTRNAYRGVPDSLEVKERFGDSVVVLEEEYGEIDLTTGDVVRRRTHAHDSISRDRYLSQFDSVPYPYTLSSDINVEEIIALLSDAHRKAVQRIRNLPSSWICFKIQDSKYLCVHSEQPGAVSVVDEVEGLKEREVISIDKRLLHGLLTKKFHWNNAEIGSHFGFYRVPDSYDQRVYDFLNFLHV